MWAWYNIVDLKEFDKLGTPDLNLQPDLDGLGLVNIRIVKGFNYNVYFLNYVLTPFLNGRNGFNKDDKVSAYIDNDRFLWVGYNEDNL